MNARPIWPFALVLVLWGNAMHPLFGASARLPGGSWSFVLAGSALIAVSLLAARVYGLTPADLGLEPRRAPRGAALGALAGIVALAGVGIVRLAPLVIGTPVVYQPLAGVAGDELVRHVALFLPLGAVLPEELAFRGTLLGAITRRSGARIALIGSAVTFSFWHAGVIVATIGQTTLGATPWAVPAMVGAFAVVFGGGLLFGVLRLRTGTLASTIVAHWLFNAVMLVGLRGLAA